MACSSSLSPGSSLTFGGKLPLRASSSSLRSGSSFTLGGKLPLGSLALLLRCKERRKRCFEAVSLTRWRKCFCIPALFLPLASSACTPTVGRTCRGPGLEKFDKIHKFGRETRFGEYGLIWQDPSNIRGG
ncbi:MAG: hypothetical protein FRX49_01497 [Trebouxia sp. A1-2]|nr:MAG: hypothetical protein FRX49_01497 [Trebouxia sp. A1-2]